MGSECFGKLLSINAVHQYIYIKNICSHPDNVRYIPTYSIYYYIQTILLGIRVSQRNEIIFKRTESLTLL